MHPRYFGDHYEFMKLIMLSGLVENGVWAYHPMYFVEDPSVDFLQFYSDFLGVQVLRDPIDLQHPIWNREMLVEISQGAEGNLFLDPDTGLNQHGGPNHLSLDELAEIALSPYRHNSLTLVYDQSINNNYRQYGHPPQQIEGKLADLHDRDGHLIHGAAYVTSQIAFLWVSANLQLVNDATERLGRDHQLPLCRFVGGGLVDLDALGCHHYGIQDCVLFP